MSEAVAKRGPKEKATTQVLIRMNPGEIFPRIKMFDLTEGSVEINQEKSKMARSMESRMTQLRRKNADFKDKKFTNQSFTAMLDDRNVVCGTVLTCISVDLAVDETVALSADEVPNEIAALSGDVCLSQMKEARVGDSIPVVTVLDPASGSVDLNSELEKVEDFIDDQLDELYGVDGFELADFDRTVLKTTLANGDILCGYILNRTA